MQVASLVLGIVTIMGFLLGLIPCFGWFNWINIPVAIVGVVLGIIAMTTNESPSKGMAIIGLVLCAIAVVVGFLRLVLGGGVI